MATDKLTKTSEPKKDVMAIVEATNKKNPKRADIEQLRELLNERASIWQDHGDLASRVQDALIGNYFESSGFVLETVKKKLANMRDEFGWQTASELEKLLIRQICLTWLRHYILEKSHHDNTSGRHSLTEGMYWEKRLVLSQKRHLKAIESLAKVRKITAQTTKLEAAASRARSANTLNSMKILEAATKSDR